MNNLAHLINNNENAQIKIPGMLTFQWLKSHDRTGNTDEVAIAAPHLMKNRHIQNYFVLMRKLIYNIVSIYPEQFTQLSR